MIKKLFDKTIGRKKSSGLKGLHESNESYIKTEAEDFEELKGKMKLLKREGFEPWFEERVMSRIMYADIPNGTSDLFFEELNFLFKRFLISAFMIILLLLSYNLGKQGDLNIEGILSGPKITVDDVIQPYSLDWSETK